MYIVEILFFMLISCFLFFLILLSLNMYVHYIPTF
jgi:hypothetical protein